MQVAEQHQGLWNLAGALGGTGAWTVAFTLPYGLQPWTVIGSLGAAIVNGVIFYYRYKDGQRAIKDACKREYQRGYQQCENDYLRRENAKLKKETGDLSTPPGFKVVRPDAVTQPMEPRP